MYNHVTESQIVDLDWTTWALALVCLLLLPFIFLVLVTCARLS